MSIIQTEFPLQFPDYNEHLTADELNETYWEQGLSYPTLGHAKAALKAMGFLPAKQDTIWKKGKQKAYLCKLRDAKMVHERSYWHGTWKRCVEVYKTESYYTVGALVTFAGNVPYLKV
jgi:hypothetical protein